MHNYYLFLAMDLAREQAAEADRYRLAASARRPSHRVNALRRIVARAAVAIARAADEAAIGRVSTVS